MIFNFSRLGETIQIPISNDEREIQEESEMLEKWNKSIEAIESEERYAV